MRISDWSSDVCSSDLIPQELLGQSARASRFRLGLFRALHHLHGLSGRDHLHALYPAGLYRPVARRREPDDRDAVDDHLLRAGVRSEEHTSELQSLMRISYAVFCLKKKNRLHLK